ncbi:MAG: uracil-DNA glycosylase family protein [Acidobacteriota bacterium]
MLLGMNPGPWGMVQTGVPFGDPDMVREWIGIEAPVRKPGEEHPRRPVKGFTSHRREISGRRLWGWARERFGPARDFFTRFFVINYCPLCFLEESGRNRTPDRLPARERRALFAACDLSLQRMAAVLRPDCVIGLGRFPEHRAREALGDQRLRIGRAPHPSPANPRANRDWGAQMTETLQEMGIALPSGKAGQA